MRKKVNICTTCTRYTRCSPRDRTRGTPCADYQKEVKKNKQ